MKCWCCDQEAGDDCSLASLLEMAHLVVTWTTQDTLREDAAAAPWLIKARQEYLLKRAKILADIKVLTAADVEGCTCLDAHKPDPDNCAYHLAAELQPWNHKIPWNCPAFHDGCNCIEHKEEIVRRSKIAAALFSHAGVIDARWPK
jgi:hypothetical protein